MTDAVQPNPLDHELAARLFHERIIVLGEDLMELSPRPEKVGVFL